MKHENDDAMVTGDHEEMLEQQHRKILWAHLTNVVLGAWLITSPLTFGYRNPGLIWGDIASGILLIVFGLLSLAPRRLWAPWAVCFVGIWLGFAPLVFWASTAAAYVNNTLVSALVIALSVLIPGMPGMMTLMKPGPEIPPDWTYNPSAWLQRAPIIGLAFVGWFGSRYLAAYQLDGWRDDRSNGRMRHLLFSAIRCAGYSGGGAGNCSA